MGHFERDAALTEAELLRAERALLQARIAFARGDARRCKRYLEQGFATARGTDDPVEVALLVQAAQLTAWEGDPETARAASSAALAAATRVGAFVADAQLVAGQALYLQHSAACIDHYRAAAAVAAGAGDLDLEFEARASEAGALYAFGDAAGAIESAARLGRAARTAGKALWAQESEWRRTRVEWLRTGLAAPAVEELRRLARGGAVGLHRPQLLGDLALALADLGEIEDARRVIREAGRVADTRWTQSVAAFYRAEIEWASGSPRRALAAGAEALAGDPPAFQAAVARGTRLWAWFELGQPQGDAELDQVTLVPTLQPVQLESEAFRRLAANELEAAADALGAAASGWAGTIARCELRALWGKGELLRRFGDRQGAAGLLTTVERRAAAAGVVPLVGRARASLRELAPPRARHRQPRLSSREHEVLGFVGQDWPTKKIAATLAISPRTVDSHIASAMSKLGASTRKQAAALRMQAGDGATPLDVTAQEEELLSLLASGHSVNDAASRIGVSRRTASRRLRLVRQRNGITGTTAIAHYVSLHGR